MTVIVNNKSQVYTSKQRILLCLNVDSAQSSQLQVLGSLAPNTTGGLYYTGTLLAKYGDNSPSPELVGYYVNFDPTSLNDDQKVCVGAISGEFVNGVTGVVITTPATAANTINMVNVIEWSIGTTYYDATLADTAINAPAVLAGFKAQYVIKELATVYLNDTLTAVSSIQGVV
jgi:hypothetical protein